MNIPRPTFQIVQFTPSSQEQEMLDSVVRWVDAVGHERLEGGGNHWCLYFCVGEDRSVCMDTVPSYIEPGTVLSAGSKANVLISHSTNRFPSSAEKAVKLDIPGGTTVRVFFNLLMQHGRHRYEFDSEGKGCRFWIDHQINLFYQHGLFVNEQQVQEAKAAILTEWPGGKQYPHVVGAYY